MLGSAAGTEASLKSQKLKKNMKRIVAAAMIPIKIEKRKKNKRNSKKIFNGNNIILNWKKKINK